MARSHDFGRRCEDAAAAALTCNGWIVRNRNFRDGPREIDLVVQRGQTIAFVEVKGRTSDRHHDPLATVDWRKRRDLARAARAWIAQYGRPGEYYRFDAVAVIGGAAGPRLEHIEDAWRIG
jgi:putative endonuclease